MSRQVHFFLILGMFLIAGNVFPQRIGLLPPSVNWKQIRNDSLRVIFPDGEEERAVRVASLMLKLSSVDPITTKGRYKPISVLLQPQTNVSNGYVGLAPYVSELYLQPNENPFSLGSLPWHELLAIHEYRHVQQVNAANRGFSHLVKLVFGELAFTGMYSLAVPKWYREGDAVYAETKWTRQGRGRLSNFILPFHEKLLQGVTWNYYKLRNGSYKEFTPDNYSLGYLLVQYGNHVFGEATWDTILQVAPTFKYLYKPFSGAVQAKYGKRTKFLYLDAMEWYAGRWEGNKEKDILYPLIPMSQKDMNDDFLNMTYPDVADDGSIYASVTSFDHTTAIYRFETDRTKHKVTSMGLQQDPYFDYANHRLVWTELRFDPRWIRKDKNVIIVLDENTGKRKILYPDKGFFTPSLDRAGNRIAALHVDQEGNYNVQILDAHTGGLLGTLPNKDNLYLGYPIWSADELSIIATSRDDKGRMALVSQDIATGNIKPITHYSYNVLGRPFLHDQWIYLTTTLDTLDQVYAVDIHEGIFYRLSRGSTAHYDPTWDPINDEIVCSEYHLNGNKLIRLPGHRRDWKLTGLNDGVKPVEGAAQNLLAPSAADRSFDIKKYSPWSNPINIHSWTATVNDPFFGAEIRSNNIMNNISIAGGIEYNRDTKSTEPYANVSLGMWYPVVSFGVSQIALDTTASDGHKIRLSNDKLHMGVSLPLFYSGSVYHQTVWLSSTFYGALSRERPKPDDDDDFRYNYINYKVILINSRNQAYRQAMPSWGQRLDVSYSHEAFGIPISQIYIASDLAFPGIKPSHYLLAQGEYLSQDISKGSIRLTNLYAGARGFNFIDSHKQYRMGLTYGFPVWYPNIGFGNILYSRRVRLQPFYDVAYSDNPNATSHWMRSMGAELIIDFHFPPFSIGLRFSKLLSGYTGKSNVFELFIPAQRF